MVDKLLINAMKWNKLGDLKEEKKVPHMYV